MILFSTLTQPIVLYLFTYMGFMSGLVFFSIFLLCKYLKKLVNTKLSQKKEKENIKKINQNSRKEKKQVSPQRVEKVSKFFAIFFTIFFDLFVIICFCFVLFLSFYLNLKYNYGEISFICIIFYILFFALSKVFVNLIIKESLNFYKKIKLKRVKM